MRNSYGNDIVALEELPMKRWIEKGDENWDGYITDQLYVGGDFRIQGIQYNKSNSSRKTAFFPMQADIYSNLKLNENAELFTKVGIMGRDNISIEYWTLLKNLTYYIWLKIGKSLPKNSYISTGTCTPAIPIQKGDEVIADFGKLGDVSFIYK